MTLQSLPSCRNPSDSSLRKKYSLAATALEYQLLAHIAINSCNSMLKAWAEREFVKKTLNAGSLPGSNCLFSSIVTQ